MRPSLPRRVLMLLLGVPAPGPQPSPRAPDFAAHPLGRRVAAGLLGVPLAGVPVRQRVPVEREAAPLPQRPYADAELPELVLSPGASEALDRPRSHRGRLLLRTALAGALGVAAVFGSVWVGLAFTRSGEADWSGPGAVVAVADPLDVGDCVIVDWPGGTAFQGEPRLKVDPGCDGPPDGQVLAVVPAATATEARRDGPGECERRTKAVRAKLADVRGFAIVPTRESFAAAGRRTACLVLGAHGAVYGPLDVHRKLGTAFTDTANMQIGDCLNARTNREPVLVSCSGRHDQEVIGFTRLDADVPFAEAQTGADAACARDVLPGAHDFDSPKFTVGFWVSSNRWSATHTVVCTVQNASGGALEGNRP